MRVDFYTYDVRECRANGVPTKPVLWDNKRGARRERTNIQNSIEIQGFQWNAYAFLGIQISVFRVCLDKIAARLDLIAHKHRKQSVCLQCILDSDAL